MFLLVSYDNVAPLEHLVVTEKIIIVNQMVFKLTLFIQVTEWSTKEKSQNYPNGFRWIETIFQKW